MPHAIIRSVARRSSSGTRLLLHNLIKQRPTSDQQNKKVPVHHCRNLLGRFRRDKRAMVSLGVIVFFIVLAIFGPPIYQHIGGTYQSAINGTVGPALYHNPFHQELANQDNFISAQYWLGTDSIGRDLLARLMQGLLISISRSAYWSK